MTGRASEHSDHFAFDARVAGRYNTQRAHPPEVSRAIGETIARQMAPMGPGARVLEIGIGTGRIAWPVVMAGCPVVGIDISNEMLGQVYQEHAPQPDLLMLTQADMHHMPFANRSFGGVLAVHVLHLARDWQAVLREAARLLKPGGAFIQGDDWIDPTSVIGRLRDELRRRVAALAPQFRPPAAGASIPQALAALGGTQVETIQAAEWTVWISPAERLRAIEQRVDAESWILTDALFEEMLRQLRAFAAETWPDLDEKRPVTRRFLMTVTRGEWTG